jgi:hypothetical protein
MLECSKSPNSDQSRIKTLLDIIHNQFSEIQDVNSDSEQFLSALHVLSEESKLSTGLCMQTIWEVAKPLTASSFQALDDLLALEKISRDLDILRVQANFSISELTKIRQHLIRAMKLTYKGGVDVQNLIEGINEVVKSTNQIIQTKNKSSEFYFGPEFEMLCQHKDLALPFNDDQVWMNYIKLSICAGRSTTACIVLGQNRTAFILHRLRNFCTAINEASIISNHFELNVMHKL